MSRKPRSHTAEVTIRFRVPKDVSAARAKRLVWNHLTGTAEIYPDAYEEDFFGSAVIRPRAISARILKP